MLNIEKFFDNEDLNEPVEDWVQQELENRFDGLMKKYNTNFVEIYLVDVDDETKTIGYYLVLN